MIMPRFNHMRDIIEAGFKFGLNLLLQVVWRQQSPLKCVFDRSRLKFQGNTLLARYSNQLNQLAGLQLGLSHSQYDVFQNQLPYLEYQ